LKRRKQTAISRHRRAPAAKGLSSSEEADASDLNVYLRCDARDSADAKVLLDGLVRAVNAWQPRIGGGRTTGLGFGHVTQLTHRTFDLDTSTDLITLATATQSGGERVDALLTSEATTAQLKPTQRDPLLTATMTIPTIGLLQEMKDVRTTHGSQWKGMLRSRVEYIARSLGHSPCIGDDPDHAQPSRQHQWTGCGTCDLCRAFGSATAAGAWEFHTMPWGDASAHTRQRNAIDRFTSGVRDGALFEDDWVSGVTTTLTITEHHKAPGWVLVALLHALHDLDDGLWGIGPRTAIGHGTVSITAVRCPDVGGERPVDLEKLPAVELPRPVDDNTGGE